jgi:hypothetical protein
MARKAARPEPTSSKPLRTRRTNCPHYGKRMWADYDNYRTVTTLEGLVRLTLKIRRCRHPPCQSYLRPYRPEAEGRYALPQHEFGLDVIALAGALRYAEHRSIPEIHRHLVARGVVLGPRERNTRTGTAINGPDGFLEDFCAFMDCIGRSKLYLVKLFAYNDLCKRPLLEVIAEFRVFPCFIALSVRIPCEPFSPSDDVTTPRLMRLFSLG